MKIVASIKVSLIEI